MAANISDIVRQLLDGMHTLSKSETLIGEPIQTKNATVIPIHRLRIGFAAGTAAGKANATERAGKTGGRGAVGTVQIDPVAAIAVGPDGTPRVLAVDGESEGGLQRLLDQLPDLALRAVKGLSDRAVADGGSRDRSLKGSDGDDQG